MALLHGSSLSLEVKGSTHAASGGVHTALVEKLADAKAFEAVAPDRLQINGAREAEHEASSTEEMGLGFERA